MTTFEKLDLIEKLEPDWNGYGADPIPKEIIDRGREFVKDCFPCPEVFPSAAEMIQFELYNDDFYLEVQVFKDKFSFMVVVDDKEYHHFDIVDMKTAISIFNTIAAVGRFDRDGTK